MKEGQSMQRQWLREIVERRLGGRWSEFAQQHPHLAAAIDRTRLIEATVQRLEEDERFVQAMREADLDEAKLTAAAQVLDQADRWLRRLLPL